MKSWFFYNNITMAFLLALIGCTSATTDSYPELGGFDRIDPAFDELVPSDARIEKISEGFAWSEGPVWRKSEGYLLFTDIPNNTIYKWTESDGLSVFLRPAGYTRSDPAGRELGSNGLMFDDQDRLVMADHGNHQIARLDETNFTKVTLADQFQENRLNSPNDLIFRSNGDIYFTDPPYGLEGLHQSPHQELDFAGVYRLTPEGELTLLADDLRFPNGIAFSPDEKTLYVAVSDPDNQVVMAYEVLEDGTIRDGRVFFDATHLAEMGKQGLPDGMVVDVEGNIFATGPGGVLVLSPDGTHLGTLETGEPTANCTFGGDGSTLYITSNMNLLRVQLNTTGMGF